jgi:hypothetical protein
MTDEELEALDEELWMHLHEAAKIGVEIGFNLEEMAEMLQVVFEDAESTDKQ